MSFFNVTTTSEIYTLVFDIELQDRRRRGYRTASGRLRPFLTFVFAPIASLMVAFRYITVAPIARRGNLHSPSGRRTVFLARPTLIDWQSFSGKASTGPSWVQGSSTTHGGTGMMSSHLFLQEQGSSFIPPLLFPYRRALRFFFRIHGFAQHW